MENQIKSEEKITITHSNLTELLNSFTQIEQERMEIELQKALKKKGP